MRNRPDALELIDIADKTLADEVATDLTKRQRYNVAMISSALGIARRELAGGVSAFPGESEALQKLYGTARREWQKLYGGMRREDPAASLDQLNKRFAADLRRGRFDAKGRERTIAMELLAKDVLARLAEDNPRYEK